MIAKMGHVFDNAVMHAKRIALIGDMHYFSPDFQQAEVTEEQIIRFYRSYLGIVKQVSKTQEVFCVGDYTHRGTKREYKEIDTIVRDAELNFHHVMGNHDLFAHTRDELMVLPYYCRDIIIETDFASFLLLDTALEKDEDHWGGTLNRKQLEILDYHINKNTELYKVILMHHPVYKTTEGAEERYMSIDPANEIGELLVNSKRGGLVISGHVHTTCFTRKGQWAYLQLPSIFAARHVFYLQSGNAGINLCCTPIHEDQIIKTAEAYGRGLIGHTYITDGLPARPYAYGIHTNNH